MNLKEVEELIRFVSKANVSEVELETKDVKLIIKTSRSYGEQPQVVVAAPIQQAPVQQAPVAQAPIRQAAPEAPRAEAKGGDESKYIAVKSPMIGTFYRSSAPDKPPFVNVGDKVEKGKVICIIEAMKLFNEIEAEVSGTVVKVVANDASPVEYDQVLFLIDPA